MMVKRWKCIVGGLLILPLCGGGLYAFVDNINKAGWFFLIALLIMIVLVGMCVCGVELISQCIKEGK